MRKKIFIGILVLLVAVALYGFYLYHRATRAGVIYAVRDFYSGGPEVVLRWNKNFGCPALLSWATFPSDSEAALLFYKVKVPEFGLESKPFLLPARVTTGTITPIVLIKREWFPELLRRLQPGEKFKAVIKAVVKKDGKTYALYQEVKVLYKGTVMGGE